MKKITLHNIRLWSLFKLGLLVGLALNLLPAVFMTVLSYQLIRAINRVFEAMAFKIGGTLGFDIDLIKQLGLQTYAEIIKTIAAHTAFQMILVGLGILLASALYTGVVVMLGGALFNLFVKLAGGLDMVVSEEILAAAANKAAPIPVYNVQPNYPPVSQQMPGPRLEITQPFRQSFPLVIPTSLIGSGPNCAVRLNGLPAVHFQISQEGDQVILRDVCQGQLPIQVQGHLVQGANLLKDGFVIQTGGYTINYRSR